MDAVIGAQHAFSEALEGLCSCEVEEDGAERMVGDARGAVGCLSDAMKEVDEMEEVSVAMRADGSLSGESTRDYSAAWVQAVIISWSNVVRERNGVRAAKRLDAVAPNLCASWLDALKALGSCALLAQGMISRQREARELEGGDSTGSFYGEVSESERLVNWTVGGFLSAAWPGLKDRGGLRSSRWRTRVAAVQFLSSLAEHDLDGSQLNECSQALLEDLLQALIFGTGLVDTQWQVRRAVVPAVTSLLTASRVFHAKPVWANLTWGVLAICVDPQTEVQAAARDSVLQQLLPPWASYSQVLVQGLLDRFITVALGAVEASDSSKDDNTLLSAVHAAILLKLVPHQSAFEVQEHGNVSIDRLPLLVVAASAALADSENKGDKVYSASLSQLIRSIGSYSASLLAMLNPTMPLYECDKLARYCKRRGVLDEVTALKLEKVSIATSLKALAAAFAASERTMKNYDESMGNKQLDALQHISEMLHIPSQLTRSYKEKSTEGEVESYLLCGKFYLKMALVLVKDRVWTVHQAWGKEDVIYNIFLSFSALASGIVESEKTWVDETGLCKLCNDVILCFSEALQTESGFFQDEIKSSSSGNSNNRRVSSLEALVLRLLPKLLLKFKGVLKSGTRSATLEIETAVPKMDDLPVAIISAHQLRWSLIQVQYPNFKVHSEMVIRTALTALDHYSPSIKRQGMKAFIHLATNINATELCWFEDAILDAVTRSLIGSDDLWPVAVEMAVALVTRIEGENRRGQWYGAIMKEMLEDLERHRSDQTRRVVWLQLVTPQFESMGIVLVAHFKRLLPLLYYWLHAQDETTQLLVLTNLRTIIKSTWPRIPFHAFRMQEELTRAERDGQERKSSPNLFAAIDAVERLLQLITSPTKSGVSLASS